LTEGETVGRELESGKTGGMGEIGIRLWRGWRRPKEAIANWQS
jgi:hypothetical protein